MKNTKTVTLHTVSIDDIVSIEVSGGFYKRLVGAYFNYVSKFTPEKFEELAVISAQDKYEQVKDEQDKIDAYSLNTIITLIAELENKFKDAGMIKKQEVEVPNED